MKKIQIKPWQFFENVSFHNVIVTTMVIDVLIFLVESLKVPIKIWQVLFWPLGFNLRPLNKNKHKKCQLTFECLKFDKSFFSVKKAYFLSPQQLEILGQCKVLPEVAPCQILWKSVNIKWGFHFILCKLGGNF